MNEFKQGELPVDIVCKGDWLLGSACGQCSRCKETALDAAIKLKAVVKELREAQPSSDEKDALWSWHNDQEHHHAGRGEYDDAKYHQQRQAVWKTGSKTNAG